MSSTSNSSQRNAISTISGWDDTLFGLQDAAEWATYGQQFYLFKRGCQVHGKTNCTAACTNGTLIFSNDAGGVNVNAMYTFQNCLVYPNISDLLSTGSLSKSDRNNAMDFGIHNETATVTSIRNTVGHCFQDYCRDNITCGKDWNKTEGGYWPLVRNF